MIIGVIDSAMLSDCFALRRRVCILLLTYLLTYLLIVAECVVCARSWPSWSARLDRSAWSARLSRNDRLVLHYDYDHVEMLNICLLLLVLSRVFE